MSNIVLQYAREREPRFREVPDDELTLYLGERHPEFLKEPTFKSVFEARQQQAVNTAITKKAETAGKIAGLGAEVAETMARFPERAARNVGGLINWTGEMLAADVGNVLNATTGLDPAGPVYQGLKEAGRIVPQVGGAMALQAAGVPAPLAFGAPAGAATFEATGDPGEAARSAAIAAVIPGVAGAARQATGKVLASGLERGIGPTSPTVQKAIEAVGSQAGVQVLLEGMNLPHYVQMSPEQRREAILRNAISNLAFLPLDAPTVMGRGPSETQQRVRPSTELALAWRDRINDPEVVDSLMAFADEEALRATRPGGGAKEQPIPEGEPTLRAQFAATLDPASTKAVTLLVPGTPDMTLPPGLDVVEVPQGLAVFNPEKVDAEQVKAGGAGAEFDGRLLGMSQAKKPDVPDPVAVTTRAPDGTPEVVGELVARDPAAIARAIETQRRAVPGGTPEIQRPEDALAERVQGSKSPAAPTPAAETITGQVNERTGSEGLTGGTPRRDPMPAERPSRPKPTSSAGPSERGWDLIDQIEANIGKINLGLILEANPDFKPRWAARRIFTRKGGMAADVAADSMAADGIYRGEPGQVDQLAEAINAAAIARQGMRKALAKQSKAVREEAKQLEQFERKVLQGQRPKRDSDNVEQVGVDALVEGDAFEVQGQRFTVEKLEWNEDGELVSVIVEDGPKFGVQRIEPDNAEVIHVDRGTYKTAEVSSEFLPGASEKSPLPPKTDESFALERVTEEQLKAEELARAKAAEADKQRAEIERRQSAPLTGDSSEVGQGALFATGEDLFSGPSAERQARRPGAAGHPAQPQGQFGLPALPPGAPTATPFKRMLVAMERVQPGFTTIARIGLKLRQIVDIARGIEGSVPVRTGRLSKRYEGVYTTPPRVIRVWDLLNLPTQAHEIAHALADALFGTAHSRGVKGLLPTPAARELRALGVHLYGRTRPAAGYIAEGWAELLADYLTSDTGRTRAPQATAWLEGTILKAYPEVAKKIKEARSEIDIWRGMGAAERLRAQTGEVPGRLAKLRKNLSTVLDRRGLVEEFQPLEALSADFTRLTGRTLKTDEDPFLIASARRGTAGGVLEYMVEEGMLDPAGNRTGLSLREALAPVTAGVADWQIAKRKEQAARFWDYLRARRSIERWSRGKNPGISLADAQYLKAKLETPEFQLAADGYYKWWDGVLDYLAEASPGNRPLVQAIRAASADYVPLARELDPKASKPGSAGKLSNALKRMTGSSLRVIPVDLQTMRTAEALIARAHRDQVIDAIFNLQRYEGVGAILEEVPRSQVQMKVNIEKLRQELEAMGVDTTGVPDDTLLTYYQPADTPKGSDPIIARTVNGETRWYQVPSEVYEMLQGLQPGRLPHIMDFFFGAPARAYRMGTTGLRASFSLVTNPLRDLPTFLAQSATDSNPLRRLGEYFGAMGDVVASGLRGKASPYRDLFDRLAVQSGQYLGGDIAHAKREAKGLFHGKLMKRVKTPVETLRDFLSFTEATPRIAELRLKATDLGWTPGKKLTVEQALALTLAAKRVTTDFSAGGTWGKKVAQAVPFFNASVQGTRAFSRTLKERPAQAMLYGLGMYTLPAIFNWWANKDEEWFRALPWRERFLYWNVADEQGRVWQIPRPFEWSNVFAIIPEALLDTAYTRDPATIRHALGHIFATQNPLDWPVLAKIAKEQWQNKIEFFDRPIVPRGQQDLMPGEQVGPYTSWTAQVLGRAFPEHLSARRIDAAVRGYFGGALPDLLQWIEQATGRRPSRERQEPADIPVFGRVFRRGGQFSNVNQVLADFYDLHFYWETRGRSKTKPLTTHQELAAKKISKAYDEIREVTRLAERTSDPKARTRMYREITTNAQALLKAARASGMMPSEQASRINASTFAPVGE